jgi:hypothetical protein
MRGPATGVASSRASAESAVPATRKRKRAIDRVESTTPGSAAREGEARTAAARRGEAAYPST